MPTVSHFNTPPKRNAACPDPEGARQLMPIPHVAAALAVSPATIREWVWRRRCPVVRVGRAVRIPAAWVRDYVARRTTPALPEREAK